MSDRGDAFHPIASPVLSVIGAAAAPVSALRAEPVREAPLALVRTDRLEGLDALKGLAIALVILIHTAPEGESDYLHQIVNGIARLAVPVFFSVSGFLIGTRWPTQLRLAASFRKLLGLHLLYGALYWALDPLRFGSYLPVTPEMVVTRFGAYAYPGQFFLFSLVMLHFVVAYLVPERGRGATLWVAGALGLAAATVLWLSRSAGGAGELHRIVFAHLQVSVGLWLFPFMLGIWLGHGVGVQPPRRWIALGACLAACAVTALDLPGTGAPGYALLAPYARWSILLGAALVALAIPVLAALPCPALLSALGRESFGIYVFNPLVIGLMKQLAGDPESLPEAALFGVAALGSTYALTRWLRPRLRFAFP